MVRQIQFDDATPVNKVVGVRGVELVLRRRGVRRNEFVLQRLSILTAIYSYSSLVAQGLIWVCARVIVNMSMLAHVSVVRAGTGQEQHCYYQ